MSEDNKLRGDTDGTTDYGETPLKLKEVTMRNRFVRLFLEPNGGQGGDGGTGASGAGVQQPAGQQSQQVPFDYEKLASIIAGKQNVTEDTILKNYFKQQGLSQEDAQKAMAAFKEQKAANTPDTAALQTQVAQANALAQKAQIEQAATLAAISVGLDAKTIPYVLKMADMSDAMGQDGKINDEAVKAAVNKVLEDVPMLKPAASGNIGFRIGGDSGQQGQQTQTTTTNQVPTKRWNRFNN